jgi:hypothetical protein
MANQINDLRSTFELMCQLHYLQKLNDALFILIIKTIKGLIYTMSR